MEENFNMRKIHAGYVVEFRNGQRAMAMRYDNGNTGPNMLFISPSTDRSYGRVQDWNPDTLKRINSSGDFTQIQDLDIMRVYGYVRTGYPTKFVFSTAIPGAHGREKLWERKTAVKMTVAQICEKLGYEVEIIKEEENQE